MRRSTTNPVACTTCTRPTREPRRGLCFGCYQRVRRGHETAGACTVCWTVDQRVLRRHLLGDGWTTLCANHAAVAGRRPIGLAALQAECIPPGDRRGLDRRLRDRRDPADRRARVDVLHLLDDRRAAGRRGTDGPLTRAGA